MRMYKEAARKTYGRSAEVTGLVGEIIENVKNRGDKELLALTKKFDEIEMDRVRIEREDIDKAYAMVSPETVEAIKNAAAQAVAAMAYGTETVKKVDLIAGPGNKFVTEAKRQVLGTVGIDSLAGPSEVLIIADELANPEFTAIDLLAQAEHDPNARATLVTTSESFAEKVLESLYVFAGELSTG